MPQVTQIVPQVALRSTLRLPAVADRLTIMPDVAHVVPDVRPVMVRILPIVAQLVSAVLARARTNRHLRPSRASAMRAAGVRRGGATTPGMTTTCMTASATVRISATCPSRHCANQTYRRKVMEHDRLAAEKIGGTGRTISPAQT